MVLSSVSKRAARFAAPVAALLVCARTVMSCVIADPPSPLPVFLEQRPLIEQQSVVPAPPSLVSWPGEFVVEVEEQVPGQGFQWSMFVDYPNPNAPDLGRIGFQAVGPGNAEGGVYIVTVPTLASPPDPSQCHVVEFLVASQFEDDVDHTPNGVGGDSVLWFYNPPGCTAFDAGAFADGSFPQVMQDGASLMISHEASE